MKPGERLPSLSSIQENWGISHETAAKAVRALKDALYAQPTNQGTFVYLGSAARKYQLLCNLLNELEVAGQELQTEDGEGVPAITGRDGGVTRNPDTGLWERPTM